MDSSLSTADLKTCIYQLTATHGGVWQNGAAGVCLALAAVCGDVILVGLHAGYQPHILLLLIFRRRDRRIAKIAKGTGE